MTKEEFEVALTKDTYLKKRKSPSEAEQQLFLKEVHFNCPLCGKDLRNRKQKKSNKLYEIAHIYPNSPTQEQFEALTGLERLGDNTEAFENKVALCKDCHEIQDYHTSCDDYLALLQKKKVYLQETALNEVTFTLGLENDISEVIKKICCLRDDEFSKLNYSPVPITNKFAMDERILKLRISMYVTEYYPYIRELFREMEGKNGFRLLVLNMQIKCCFAKMEIITNDKNAIYEQIVDWVYIKTLSISRPACEAVVAFFVQNCEVFHEIAK